MNKKEINNYPKYAITDTGDVYSLKWAKKRKLKPQRASQSKKGYVQVRLFNQEYPKGRLQYIHRLVWESFRGDIPKDKEIDHIDGNPRNNKLSNLQILTRRGNTRKYNKEAHGYYLRDNRDEIIEDYKKLGSMIKVADKWNKSTTAIWRTIRNLTHKRLAGGKTAVGIYDENLKDEFTAN